MKDFDYLSPKDIYLDSACQSLRPQTVINALNAYYLGHNSCGERVKYRWGEITDQKIVETRQKVLKYLKLRPKEYFASFTLNTTYGINLLIEQLDPHFIKKVITSDIEHNSSFLPTITFAKRHKIKREVIKRNADGSLPLETDFYRALVVVNCVSNFDGRTLQNLKALVQKVRKADGVLIIDAAQAMAHSPQLLYRIKADAICFSAHKMYSASLGGMIIRKDLLPRIKTSFIGGGMVDDVKKNSFTLSSDNPDHIHTCFESGLQAYGEIIALGAAIDWLEKLPKTAQQNLEEQTKRLYDFLKSRPKVHLINTAPNQTMSCYIDSVDSHLIGAALGDQRIMIRTGYFCAHYYLDHSKHYPPLLRFSLGYHTRPQDIDAVIAALDKVTK